MGHWTCSIQVTSTGNSALASSLTKDVTYAMPSLIGCHKSQTGRGLSISFCLRGYKKMYDTSWTHPTLLIQHMSWLQNKTNYIHTYHICLCVCVCVHLCLCGESFPIWSGGIQRVPIRFWWMGHGRVDDALGFAVGGEKLFPKCGSPG